MIVTDATFQCSALKRLKERLFLLVTAPYYETLSFRASIAINLDRFFLTNGEKYDALAVTLV